MRCKDGVKRLGARLSESGIGVVLQPHLALSNHGLLNPSLPDRPPYLDWRHGGPVRVVLSSRKRAREKVSAATVRRHSEPVDCECAKCPSNVLLPLAYGPGRKALHPVREEKSLARGESSDMRIRQMVLVASIVLTVSSQAIASVNLSVPGTPCSYFTGQNFLISAPAPWAEAVFFGDLTKPGTISPFVDVSFFDDPIPATGPDGYGLYQSVAEPYKAFGVSAAEEIPMSTSLGVFLADDTSLPFKRPPSLILGVSDMASLLFQQVFANGTGLKNVAIPSGATRLFFGINDERQWSNNIGELSLSVTTVPAPVAILIGSIGVGLIGWMRKLKTYTA